MKRFFLILAIVTLSACVDNPPQTVTTTGDLTCEDGPGDVFESRIEPLLEQNSPQSCGNCHLANVKLTEFVRGDACQSMACLVERELVDLSSPADSKVLKFMRLGHQAAASDLITADVVNAEHDAFLTWIEYASSCHADTCETIENPCEDSVVEAGPVPDCEDGDCKPLTLESYGCEQEDLATAWFDHVGAEGNRCEHCHAPQGITAGIANATLWFDDEHSPEGAQRTIDNLIGLNAFDFNKPAESRLLTKPLRPELGGIAHGGSSKFSTRTDPLYVAMYDWILLQKRCLK